MIGLRNPFRRAPRLESYLAPTPPTVAERLYAEVIKRSGDDVRLVGHSITQWASVTFTGSRHTFEIRFFGEYANVHLAMFITALRNDNFVVDGVLVCDLDFPLIAPRQGECPYAEVRASVLLLDDRY